MANEGRRLWRALDPRQLDTWIASVARLTTLVTAAQLRQASTADEYVDAVLKEQGETLDSAGDVVANSLVGISSDGRSLSSLLFHPVITTKQAIGQGSSVDAAMALGQAHLDAILRTEVSDAGRVADGLAVTSRSGARWVRVLYGETCSRCAVLAGRIYRWQADFERHPQCDCYAVPTTSEDDALKAGIMVDPKKYFESLSREEQDKIFTVNGAQAIRDGADIGQVVNVRRGANGMAPAGARLTREERAMYRGRLEPVKVFGRDVYATTEGTTRRGLYGQRAARRGSQFQTESAETVTRRSRNGDVQRTVQRNRIQTPRLMPESIYQLATSREDAIRLLRLYGYIL